MQVVLGAGPVGRAIADQLVAAGEEVVLASRSGAGKHVSGVRRVAVDAANPDAVVGVAKGASVIYNALNPTAYHQWPQLWPPMADAIRGAGEQVGAVVATVSNLYAYGRVDSEMTESLPDRPVEAKGRVRAQMWAKAKSAHDAGRVRAVEVRASDYVGVGVGEGSHLTRLLPRAAAGKAVSVIGSPDQPHSWTAIDDVATSIIAVAKRPEAHGKVWIAATNPPRTQREGLSDILSAAGRSMPKVSTYPAWMWSMLAPVWPFAREIRAVSYQFDRPFVVNSDAISEAFGVVPTPWSSICEEVAREEVVPLP